MSNGYAKVRPRRSTKSEWEFYDPILLEGEMGIEVPDDGIGTGRCKIKIGDGLTPWNHLSYAIDTSSATSIHGGTCETFNDIWLRSDTTDNWLEANPVLGVGEIVFDMTVEAFKVGDGSHSFSDLKYIGLDNESDMDLDFGDEDSY